ncbi:MAG: sulfatase [Planctomycetota bacterium]
MDDARVGPSAGLGYEGTLREWHLVFEELTEPAWLDSIELVRRPASMRLPSPEHPVHFAVGTGSRPAVGLLPGHGVGVPIPAGLHGRVVLDASLPPAVRSKEGQRLTLILTDGTAEIDRHTVALKGGWQPVSWNLPRAEGALELRAETDAEMGMLLSQPLVIPESKRPARSILLVTSDTHRADHFGSMPGGVGVHTPRLDGLAARGVRFDQAISVTSITNPSHAALFTGLHARDHGIVGNLAVLSERAETLAERFEAAGYRTVAATSARHLMPWRSGFGQGFQRFDAPSEGMYRDGEETIAAAKAMLADCAGQDTFLWLHLFDAHAPYKVHEEYMPKYYQGDPYDPSLPRLEPPAQASWDPEIRDLAYIQALYKGEVSYVDHLMDRFLDQNDRFERDVMLFTADHGESLGEHYMFWGHAGLYTTTVRVPLFVFGPGMPAGRSVQAGVSNHRLGRTLLGLAGLPAEEFPGVDLLQEIDGPPAEAGPRFVLGANALSAGVFFENWYLLLHIRESGWGNHPIPESGHGIELFQLDTDPLCAVNVADQNPQVVGRLRNALVRWLNTSDPRGPLTGTLQTSAQARSDVAALGYAADEFSSVEGPILDPTCGCTSCRYWREREAAR